MHGLKRRASLPDRQLIDKLTCGCFEVGTGMPVLPQSLKSKRNKSEIKDLPIGSRDEARALWYSRRQCCGQRKNNWGRPGIWRGRCLGNRVNCSKGSGFATARQATSAKRSGNFPDSYWMNLLFRPCWFVMDNAPARRLGATQLHEAGAISRPERDIAGRGRASPICHCAWSTMGEVPQLLPDAAPLRRRQWLSLA